jgi:hypothetical protein
MLIPDAYRRLEKERGALAAGNRLCGYCVHAERHFDALESPRGGRVAVLGWDVLKIASGAQPDGLCYGKPEPTYGNWYADRRPGEDLMDYIERSIAEAERYIRSYPDLEDGTILYSPVISELGVGSNARW